MTTQGMHQRPSPLLRARKTQQQAVMLYKIFRGFGRAGPGEIIGSGTENPPAGGEPPCHHIGILKLSDPN